MIIYSIKDLEKLSGVKAHTLRIWEKRYGIIQPKRTQTNIRYYLDEDLKQILNIAFLNKKGYRISKIAALSNKEIRQKVAEYTEINSSFEDYQLDALTLCVLELNESKFSKILDKYITQKGFLHVMNHVIYPLLDKLGMMWMSGSIKSVHEHFVSNVVRRKTINAIDRIKESRNEVNNPKFLIYLPEGENHELSLLYLHYILKEKGMRVVNVGIGIPLDDVIDGCRISKPDFVFTMVNDSLSNKDLEKYIDQLTSRVGNAEVLLSGMQVIQLNQTDNANYQAFKGTKQLIDFVDNLLKVQITA